MTRKAFEAQAEFNRQTAAEVATIIDRLNKEKEAPVHAPYWVERYMGVTKLKNEIDTAYNEFVRKWARIADRICGENAEVIIQKEGDIRVKFCVYFGGDDDNFAKLSAHAELEEVDERKENGYWDMRITRFELEPEILLNDSEIYTLDEDELAQVSERLEELYYYELNY